MSNQQNDAIFEDALENFRILCITSNSFYNLVSEIISREWDGMTPVTNILTSVFSVLWSYDCELLVTDPRACVQSYLDNRAMCGDLSNVPEGNG